MTSTANATASGDMHGVQDAEPTDTEHEKSRRKQKQAEPSSGTIGHASNHRQRNKPVQ